MGGADADGDTGTHLGPRITHASGDRRCHAATCARDERTPTFGETASLATRSRCRLVAAQCLRRLVDPTLLRASWARMAPLAPPCRGGATGGGRARSLLPHSGPGVGPRLLRGRPARPDAVGIDEPDG